MVVIIGKKWSEIMKYKKDENHRTTCFGLGSGLGYRSIDKACAKCGKVGLRTLIKLKKERFTDKGHRGLRAKLTNNNSLVCYSCFLNLIYRGFYISPLYAHMVKTLNE